MAIGVAAAGGLSPDLALPHEVANWMASRRYGVDVVTPALVDRFHATLGRPIAPVSCGDPAPLGLHWCLAPEATATANLCPDGLPNDGGIIPPVRHLTGRMWGGGEVRFLWPLQVDDRVERVSRLIDITEKIGRSGRLAFARIQHDYQARGMTCVSEIQTIVFRDPLAVPPAESPVHGEPEAWDFSRSITIEVVPKNWTGS